MPFGVKFESMDEEPNIPFGVEPMTIAEQVECGAHCSGCGVCFEQDHGYPVLCKSCFQDRPKKYRIGLQRAFIKEL